MYDEKENEKIKCPYSLKKMKKMEFWRTDSVLQVRDKGSRAIFILITKTGQMKKLHPDVQNTTFFRLDYIKSAIFLAALIKTSQIALWYHVIDACTVLKTGLRQLVKRIRNCFKKCMEYQKVLKWELFIIPKTRKLCLERFSKALSLLKSKLSSLWNQNILQRALETENSKTTRNSADNISDKIYEQSFKQTVR